MRVHSGMWISVIALAACQPEPYAGPTTTVSFDADSDVRRVQVEAVACDGADVRTFDVDVDGRGVLVEGRTVVTVELPLEAGCYDLVARPMVDETDPSLSCAAVAAPQVALDASTRLDLASECVPAQDLEEWGVSNLRTDDGCTLTPCWWMDNPDLWTSASIKLGARTYDAQAMMDLLWTDPEGDVSVMLAQEAIALWLNVKSGAVSFEIRRAISDMQWVMARYDDGDGLPYGLYAGEAGYTKAVSVMEIIRDYNLGIVGPGHCDDEPSGQTSVANDGPGSCGWAEEEVCEDIRGSYAICVLDDEEPPCEGEECPCTGPDCEPCTGPDCEPEPDKRWMTGGGNFDIGGTRFTTHGFVVRCDVDANGQNLQINWRDGRTSMKFHMTSLVTAECIDNPELNEEMPVAGFDTFVGTGVGTINGVAGATIEFTFTDDGEPGGSVDWADVLIRDAAGNVVVDWDAYMRAGNHQAHAN